MQTSLTGAKTATLRIEEALNSRRGNGLALDTLLRIRSLSREYSFACPDSVAVDRAIALETAAGELHAATDAAGLARAGQQAFAALTDMRAWISVTLAAS